MHKERLTIDGIRQDLMRVADLTRNNNADWHASIIGIIVAIAIIVGVLTRNLYIGLVVALPAVYQYVRCIADEKRYKSEKRALKKLIESGEVSVSRETLSHISTETIYEPYAGRRNVHLTKKATFYYFRGGSSWRVPKFGKHYPWSADRYISTQGLENTSIPGEDFYFVTLQGHGEISYIYPCDMFELDESLKI